MASPFVTQLPPQLIEKLREDLLGQGFSLGKAPHTVFQAKKPGVSCTLYQSGKLVVQGKGAAEFVEFYLEPELLGTFTFTHKTSGVDTTPRIGVDESGKGDFFGSLCVAAVYGSSEAIQRLAEMGVCDSKKITDKKVRPLAREIASFCPYALVRLSPERYNTLYRQFGNLNTLLGWGHATAIAELMEKTGCEKVIIDQFANERVVEKALQKKGVAPDLTQRHRGEDDLVVAAASVLARAAFLKEMERLGKAFGTELPKGASSKVIQVGRTLFAQHGVEIFPKVAKMHFKTLDAIVR